MLAMSDDYRPGFEPSELDRIEAADEVLDSFLKARPAGDGLEQYLAETVIPFIIRAARTDRGPYSEIGSARDLFTEIAWRYVQGWDSERWQEWNEKRRQLRD